METLGWPSSEDIKAVASPFADSILDSCVVSQYEAKKASEATTSEKPNQAAPAAADAALAAADAAPATAEVAYRGTSELPPPAPRAPREPLPEEELRRRWRERFSTLVEEAVLDDVVDLLFRLMLFNKYHRYTYTVHTALSTRICALSLVISFTSRIYPSLIPLSYTPLLPLSYLSLTPLLPLARPPRPVSAGSTRKRGWSTPTARSFEIRRRRLSRRAASPSLSTTIRRRRHNIIAMRATSQRR